MEIPLKDFQTGEMIYVSPDTPLPQVTYRSRKMDRVEMLKAGIELTSGDRNKSYGEPSANFDNIAELWNAYIQRKYRQEILSGAEFIITSEDVAWLNVLQKIARTFGSHPGEDTYIDAAVYAAIAGEVA